MPLAILIFALALAGCGPDGEMAERFKDSLEAHIMTDEQGRRYSVTHHIGNVYRVEPIKDK